MLILCLVINCFLFEYLNTNKYVLMYIYGIYFVLFGIIPTNLIIYQDYTILIIYLIISAVAINIQYIMTLLQA